MSKTSLICIVLSFGFFAPAGAENRFTRDIIARAAEDLSSNKSARIRIIRSGFEPEAAGHTAPPGQAFLVIETDWENIHPKQKVDKAKLEGKTDRTMGVGGLTRGKQKKSEYVEVDVPYQIPKMFDFAYLLADGLAFALHAATEDIPGGCKLQDRFTIAKQGEVRKATLAFLVPEVSKNLAFQLFDYQNGPIVVPVSGDLNMARGTGNPPGDALDHAQTDRVEFASLGLQVQSQYQGRDAPTGWAYAVVRLAGKSLSGSRIKDIAQIEPGEYTWVRTDGGYLYPCTGSATAASGVLRFTPEVFQQHELAFLVPDTEENFSLGVRVQNQVLDLDLGTKPPTGMPPAQSSHTDGDVMEILVFGTREASDHVILDLGIRSFYDRGGIDIQTKQQFFLRIGEQEFSVDSAATAALLRRPPVPFTVPPGASLRFELAFDARGKATALRYRGYKSETTLEFQPREVK